FRTYAGELRPAAVARRSAAVPLRSSVARLWRAWDLNIEWRSRLLFNHLTCEVERDGIELHHPRTFFNPRLHPTTLIRILHCPQPFTGVFGPTKLAAIVSGFLFEPSFDRRDL